MVRPNLAHVVDELYNYFHLVIRKTVQNRQNLLGHSVHNYLVDRSHPYFEKNVRKMFAVFGLCSVVFIKSFTLVPRYLIQPTRVDIMWYHSADIIPLGNHVTTCDHVTTRDHLVAPNRVTEL